MDGVHAQAASHEGRHRSGRDDIVLCHRTLETRRFADRVEAAAAAGCTAIGLSVPQYEAYREAGESRAGMVAVAKSFGVGVEEVAALHGVADHGFEPMKRFLPRLRALADVFGASFLGAHSGYDGDLAGAADRFGWVCDQVEADGVTLGLEFVPFTTLPDLRTALAIVRAADRPNGGVVIDAWHFFRGEPQFDELIALAPQEIAQVQLTDGLLEPRFADPVEDTLRTRCLPGHGDFDLERFVRAVDGVGAAVPWSVETPSDELAARPPTEAARSVVASTRALLRIARGDGTGVVEELAR